VVIVDFILTSMGFVEFGELEELKILIFATNGENDILKDNV
jgi:hypothetical protein